MKSIENLQQNIRVRFLRKEPGQISMITGAFLMLFLLVLVGTQLQLEHYYSIRMYLEDALASSNLASAIVDVEEYGISHRLLLQQPQNSYDKYKNALKGNLQLDDSFCGKGHEVVKGAVTVDAFVLYNVIGSDVQCIQVKENGQILESIGILGNVKTPKGEVVQSTGIYSEISFMTEGIFGTTAKAHMGKLAEVYVRP